MSSEKQMIEDIASFTHDPLAHALYVFPWGEPGELEEYDGPRRWQAQVMEDIGKHLRNPETRFQPCQIAVVSGHGIGKSALISMITKWAMDTCEDTKVVVTANTEKQLMTKTWPELGKWFRLAINKSWFRIEATSIHSSQPGRDKSWRADAIPWSENNTEAFAGLHNKGKRIVLVMDEASAIADKVFEVAEGAMTDEGTEIIWIIFGNGTRATGRFREAFRKFRHRWIGRQIDSRTVEGTNKQLFDKWAADYGEDSDFFKVRVRGMFPSASTKQFISEADVDAAFGKHLDEDQYSWAPIILTCDPAWEGDDELVISYRQGLRFKVLERLPKNDNDVLIANKIARYEDELDADMVFIDGGYGTGIVSAGRTMGRDWQLVWFGGESSDPGCVNKRSEMWASIKTWLKEGGAIPDDENGRQLRDELIGPETVARMDGKIQLESKSQMKKRGLPSPNIADSLALSFAFPVPFKRTREEEILDEWANQPANYDSTERWLGKPR